MDPFGVNRTFWDFYLLSFTESPIVVSVYNVTILYLRGKYQSDRHSIILSHVMLSIGVVATTLTNVRQAQRRSGLYALLSLVVLLAICIFCIAVQQLLIYYL
jgi:hypothetical protein